MPTSTAFRNAALIHNPLAGRRPWRRARHLERVVGLLEAYGIRTTPVVTTGPGSATELARLEAASGRDLIIVWGGDGTVNEVVNGLAGTCVPMALLPAGTANVLAKELGLPFDPWRAAEYIPEGEVRQIALGRAGQRYFVAVAGPGADAQLIYEIGRRGQPRLGLLSFWLEGFRQLFHYDFRELTVRLGEEVLEGSLVVVSRTRHYGGPIEITRRADLFGEDFEVCVFPRRFRLMYLIYFLAQLVGSLDDFPELRFRRTRLVRAEPRGERVRVQVDGELAGELPVEFLVIPGALSLLVPRKALPRVPEVS